MCWYSKLNLAAPRECRLSKKLPCNVVEHIVDKNVTEKEEEENPFSGLGRGRWREGWRGSRVALNGQK